MPVLSTFLGMEVRVFHADHDPPHFHVQHGTANAILEIRSGKVISGKLPLRQLRWLNEWRGLHLFELEQSWKQARALKSLPTILPLEN